MERRWKEEDEDEKKENNEPAPSFKVPRRCPEAVDSAHRPSSDAMSRTPKGARPPPRANKQTHGDDAHAFVFFEPKLGDEPNKNSNPIVTPEGILLLLFFFARGGFFLFLFFVWKSGGLFRADVMIFSRHLSEPLLWRYSNFSIHLLTAAHETTTIRDSARARFFFSS
jgi:hypothetical protein